MTDSVTSIREKAAHAEPWPAAFPDKDKLRALRLALNLRQADMAEAFGVSRMTILRYEAGEVGVPTSLNAEEARRVLSVMVDEAANRTTQTPEMFKWDGAAEDNPQISRDRFYQWVQQDDVGRIPFPLLPWPDPRQMDALLEAVRWTAMRTARNFGVHGSVVSRWRSSPNPPTDGEGDYSLVGAQAGWSALAWATGLPPAPQRERKRTRNRKATA